MELEVHYAGLTFVVSVEHYLVVKPQGKWADSDMDAQGYTEVDYEILMVTDEDDNLVNDYCLDDVKYGILDSLVLEAIRDSQEDF